MWSIFYQFHTDPIDLFDSGLQFETKGEAIRVAQQLSDHTIDCACNFVVLESPVESTTYEHLPNSLNGAIIVP